MKLVHDFKKNVPIDGKLYGVFNWVIIKTSDTQRAARFRQLFDRHDSSRLVHTRATAICRMAGDFLKRNQSYSQ